MEVQSKLFARVSRLGTRAAESGVFRSGNLVVHLGMEKNSQRTIAAVLVLHGSATVCLLHHLHFASPGIAKLDRTQRHSALCANGFGWGGALAGRKAGREGLVG